MMYYYMLGSRDIKHCVHSPFLCVNIQIDPKPSRPLHIYICLFFFLSRFVDTQAFWHLLSVLPLLLNHTGLIFFNGTICFMNEMMVQALDDAGSLLPWEMKGNFPNPQIIMISIWEMNAFTFWFPGTFTYAFTLLFSRLCIMNIY